MRTCPACNAEVPGETGQCPACGRALSDDPIWKVPFRTEEQLRRHFESALVHRGLLVPRPQPEAPDAAIRVHIVLPEGRGDVWLMGRVVGVVERPERAKAPYDVQLSLVDLDAQTLELLRPGGGSAAAGAAAPRRRAPVAPRPAPRSATQRDPLDAFVETLLARRRQPPPEDEQEGDSAAAHPASERVARARLPDELARELTEFTIQFVRAVTKSSYYTAEHQEAGKAKLGIYAAFQALVGERPEVTFFAHRSGERSSILVYGIFDEPADLARAMMPGQAELYLPKLIHHFEANSIDSVSFKPSLGEAEFHRFVDLLARPGSADTIARQLAKAGITGLSIVAAEDRIRGRSLSWRVEMALTRLKKDLSVIPLYENLDETELAKVRLQVFRDVLRPLRQVDLIRELLENCDHIVEEVEEFTEEQLADVEAQVLASVPDALLPPLLAGFADDIAAAKREGGATLDRLLRLARRVAEQLRPEQARSLEDAFRKLLTEEVLELEELPPALQRRFTVERDTEHFLELRGEILARLDRESEPSKYQALLDHFASIFPELLSRADPSATIAIVEHVADHRSAAPTFAERAALAEGWLEGLVHGALARDLGDQLDGADKVKREQLLELCRRLGEPVVPLLFEALAGCAQPAARQAIGAVLADLKRASLTYLRVELARDDLGPAVLEELLHVLAAVGSRADAELASRLLAHESPQARIEALATCARLDPEGGEAYALGALGDAHPKVRDAALKLLFERRSSAPGLFAFCRAALEDPEQRGSPLCHRIFSGLAGYAAGAGREPAIAVLRDALGEAGTASGGLWSSVKRSVQREAADEEVVVAACRALGRLRAVEAREALENVSRHSHAALRQAAEQALARLDAPAEP